MTEFELPDIDFGTKNKENFTGSIGVKGLIHDNKIFYEFTTKNKEIINLKQISYKVVEKEYNGGDPEENEDVWSAYVELIVLCKENNKKYKSKYLIIAPYKSFSNYQFYNTYIEFKLIDN